MYISLHPHSVLIQAASESGLKRKQGAQRAPGSGCEVRSHNTEVEDLHEDCSEVNKGPKRAPGLGCGCEVRSQDDEDEDLQEDGCEVQSHGVVMRNRPKMTT